MLNLRLPDSCYISPLGFAVGDLLHLKPSHLAKFQGEALGTIRDPTVKNPGNNGISWGFHRDLTIKPHDFIGFLGD